MGTVVISMPLPRPIRLLGWVSLLTDAATEAVYPLLPVFITQVLGGPPVTLGIVEGAADATSSILKVISGRWSDRAGMRKPIVVVGYTLSSLTRPFIAAATSWAHVFAIRVTDRVGKGLRSAPRDAMLATLAPPGERGRVFGYHWAMDHAGAAIGPLLATVFLYFSPGNYRLLFALTGAPWGAAFKPWSIATLKAFLRSHVVVGLHLVYLLHDALLAADAVLRALVRMFVTRRRLLDSCAPDVVRLGELLGRDLTHWLA